MIFFVEEIYSALMCSCNYSHFIISQSIVYLFIIKFHQFDVLDVP